jgi:hypothetical protein
MAQMYPAQLAEFWDGLQIQSASFELPVTQQVSRTAGGEVITADLGTSLWRGSATLAPRPFAEANAALARLRLMARPGSSFLVRPAAAFLPADGATATAVQMHSVSDFAGGIGAWTAGAVDTSPPDQAPVALRAALKVTDRNTYGGSSRQVLANLAGSVFRITGWVYNADNAFALRVGIQTATSGGTASATVVTVVTAGQAGWVYFDASVTAPVTAVDWRPIIRSDGTNGDPGHQCHLNFVTWERWSLSEITADRKQIRLTGLPIPSALSVGDFLSFQYGSNPTRYAFHQIAQGGMADSMNGTTPQMEVIPPLQPGAVPGTPVVLNRPVLKAIIEPGSIREGRDVRTRRSGISFNWLQTLR